MRMLLIRFMFWLSRVLSRKAQRWVNAIGDAEMTDFDRFARKAKHVRPPSRLHRKHLVEQAKEIIADANYHSHN